MRLHIGVTDGDWYRFLADHPYLTEANFWRPSGATRFRALNPGEPFFFKTHHPHNQVVGGGFFTAFELLPLSSAWEIFQEANGTTGLAQMRQRIGHYRRQPIGDDEDPIIGCILLRDTRFFASPLPAPPNFAPNIVQGKTYDLAQTANTDYFKSLIDHLMNEPSNMIYSSEAWHRDGPVIGDYRLVPQRLGQRAFQAVVLNAYRHQCAITGSRIRPALQAAHILPVKMGGEHRLDNGILLRSDVHTLFDRGYLSIDPDYRLQVSSRLRKEFDAGDEFYEHEGNKIALPEKSRDYPDPEVVAWHLREVFIP